jgi:hypothetical protein
MVILVTPLILPFFQNSHKQGFGSALISCLSGSSIFVITDPDQDLDLGLLREFESNFLKYFFSLTSIPVKNNHCLFMCKMSVVDKASEGCRCGGRIKLSLF